MDPHPGRQQWFLTCAAGLSLALGVAGTCVSFVYLPGYRAHGLSIAAGLLSGLGLAFFAIRFKPRIDEALETRFPYYASVAFLAGFFPALIDWCGMRQFGGFDQSVLIDFGWRLLNGQRPFLDFPCTAPISFFLGPYYAFLLLGVHWQSLVLIFAAFSFVTFLWSLPLLAEVFASIFDRLVLAIALQALCMVPVSFWWYNPLAATSGVIFTLSAYVWLLRPHSRAVATSYFFSLLLLATMKPNVAGLLILPVTLILLTSSEHRGKALLVSCLSFVTFLLLLAAHRMSFLACLENYRGVSRTAFVIGQAFTNTAKTEIKLGFDGWIGLLALVLILLPLAGCALRGSTFLSRWRFAGVGLACILAGLNSFLTAGDLKSADLGLVFFGVMLVCHACGLLNRQLTLRHTSIHHRVAVYLVCIAITGSSVGLALGCSRRRVLGIGLNMFFEYTFDKDAFNAGFFRDLHCGKIFKETYAQVHSIVSESQDKRIFFGPRMEWGYAAFGLPSPIRQPVWWDPGKSFPLAEESKYVNSFFQMRNDTLIFLKNDMTYYPPQLIDGIRERYSEDQTLSRLSIFRRKS